MVQIAIGLGFIVLFVYGMLIYRKKDLARANNHEEHDFARQQALYNKKNKKVTLDEEEKIELSWQFLYRIADIVWSKFSQYDRDQVHQIGKNLVKAGMSYIHDIENGLSKKNKNVDVMMERQQKNTKKDKSV